MMTRGEIWLAEVRQKRRPVLVLTRTEVIDVRALVTVVEITTTIRSTGAEVELDHAAIGLDRPSVVNGDGVHTILRSSLTTYVGAVDDDTLGRVCNAVSYAIGCPS
jgi:mRNA-degrading endonuclease toxin of MazEF toxin-antitoxin module